MDQYIKALVMYNINVVNHTSTITLWDLILQIFDDTNSGDTTAFLLSLTTPGVDAVNDPGCVTLLHTVSQYDLRDGRVETAWYGNGFTYYGDISHEIMAIVDLKTSYTYQSTTTYIPMEAVLDSTLSADVIHTLLGQYLQTYGDAEAAKVQNIVFAPTQFVKLLLDSDLYPVQVWDRLCGSIFTVGLANSCKPLLYWMRILMFHSAPHAL